MAQIKSQSEDVLLSRDQLRKIEDLHSRFDELQQELKSKVADFETLIDRHYFHRENGFLDDQQNNLREIVSLQNIIDNLVKDLAENSGSLKSFMKGLQDVLQRELPAEAPAENRAEAAGKPGDGEPEKEPAEKNADREKPRQQGKSAAPAKTPAASATKTVQSPLIDRKGENLLDPGTQGGEVSIKLFIEQLNLRQEGSREILYQINSQLKELLYNRQMIGYSATSLVFGKDKNLGQILEVLKPIFLAEPLKELLVKNRLVKPEELEKARLACDQKRELIYLVS